MPTHIEPTSDLGPDVLLARLRAHVERVQITGERSGLRQMVEDFRALDRLCQAGEMPASWSPAGAVGIPPKLDPDVREYIIQVVKRALNDSY